MTCWECCNSSVPSPRQVKLVSCPFPPEGKELDSVVTDFNALMKKELPAINPMLQKKKLPEIKVAADRCVRFFCRARTCSR